MQLFNDGWSFYLTDPETELSQVLDKISFFRPVDIPHDWLIYDTEDLYRDGTGWYHKRFAVAPEEGGRVILRFEGVYMDCTFYVNGQQAAEWKYGYSTFDADVTDFLCEGENDLLLCVRYRSPNSRWYSGAGIYRNVWLKNCPDTYLALDGTYVTMREGQESVWSVAVSTEVCGAVREGSFCRYTLSRRAAASENPDDEKQADILLGTAIVENGAAKLETTVEAPFLWSVEEPNCYRLTVELADGGAVLDTDRMTVGFRTCEFTTDRGFFLNHRHMKLHGVCEHHDLGCLGAAFHKEAMRRKLVILKDMGVNAIRTSHNMPAPGLMELADEMGFLVLSEAFDMWERSKTTYDYARFFKEWAKKDVASWVRRDRNHPSLFMWSIGNEIYDTHADGHGQEITKMLLEYVREHDPKENGKVTIGSNYMPWQNAQKCADIVKFAGYNYGEKCYEEHHGEHPDWVIYGSETASIVQSRGIYRFPFAQPCLSDEDEQCSAFSNSTTSWGSQDLERLIGDDLACEYSLGQFLWTGFDYIGEPTPYHTKNSYFGQIDTAGFPKDAYYVFQSAWRDAGKGPMVHVFPHWDWNEGQTVDVLACTNAHSVELFVNGKSMGKQEIVRGVPGAKLIAKWQVVYEPGELLAVAYDEAGREAARQVRHSFAESAALTLAADKKEIRADGEDLMFITIGMVDQNGYPVENAMDYVKVRVEGPGRLLGLDNGDSTDYDRYKTDCRKLFNGKLLAVIGSTLTSGKITVRVDAHTEGIRGSQIAFDAVPAEVREHICCSENCVSAPRTDVQERTGVPERVPIRKIELTALDGRRLTPEHSKLAVRAKLLPENTTDRDIVWEATNSAGIPLGYVKVTPEKEGLVYVEAFGDGEFRIRALAKDGAGKVRLISQLEFQAEGFGEAMLNPYAYTSAGLFAETFGDVTSGNEKGIATARGEMSGALYRRLDFGEYGSDTITVDIFDLSGEPQKIEIWEGVPSPDGGTECGSLIDTVVYHKPSIWNVYQGETWKLPRRLKGVTDISFFTRDKIHIKGFSFRYLEKAFQRLTAVECTKIYGDSYRMEGIRAEGIGNNVTVVYEGMDFGEGAKSVTIWGATPLPSNTIHLQFTAEDKTVKRAIVEYPGDGKDAPTEGMSEHTFPVEGFCGKGRLELVFLPGSDFTLEALQFQKDETEEG